jgi:hypothetical protein
VVEGLTVSGAGSLSQWTPSSGANYTCVDEDYGHNGDTDYVSSGTPGVADTYAMDDVSSSAAAIVAVQVTSIARKDDAGAHAIRNRVRLGGVNYDSAPMSVFDSYTAVMSSWLLNPATGATWSAAALNDAEVGFKLES